MQTSIVSIFGRRKLSERRTIAVAIVGSGPSGMYLAEALTQQYGYDFEIHIFDRLPTPYGLVRTGVAPDHPEKKLVIDRLFDVVIKHPRVRFFGNVEIGKDISFETLRERYSGVFFAHGMNKGRALGIPGESLSNVWTSHDFVAWYNGHPDYCENAPALTNKRAVIIGNGNVALDIARLLISPLSELKRTDIADHALNVFRKSNVQEVEILGRKAPAFAAFNNPELEEFNHYADLGVTVLPEGILENKSDTTSDYATARKLITLQRLNKRLVNAEAPHITFSFLTTPRRILGKDKVQSLEVTRLAAEQAVETTTKQIDAGLVITAIGYRGTPIEGLPFHEETGVVPNNDGRVCDESGILSGVYVTGWARRGPSGVIGTNKKCARQVVSNFLHDLTSEPLASGSVDNPVKKAELNHVVDRAAWFRVDRHERLAGQKSGTPRKKLVRVEDILEIANV